MSSQPDLEACAAFREPEHLDASVARAVTPDAIPSPPIRVRADIYSRTAAELFWDRSAVVGQRYEIRRDGVMVATTDGTSHFDDMLDAGRSYSYDIIAIERAGRRSAPARITLTALGNATPAPMISRASYEGLVAHAFELYVGDRYNAPLLPLLDPFRDVLSVAPNDAEALNGSQASVDYECESGRAELDRTILGPFDDVIVQFRFEACLERGVLRDGTIDANLGNPGSDVRSEGLRVESGPEHGLHFSGYARRGVSKFRLYYSPTWETIDLNLVGRDSKGEFTLRESNTQFEVSFAAESSGFEEASLSGSFSMRSEATGGQELFVGTPLGFHYRWDVEEPPESSGGQVPRDDPDAPWGLSDASEERRDDWYSASGQLELVGEDGSRLLLDADTGDATTVRITIDDAAGSATFETSLAPWQRLLRLALYSGDRDE